jgi:hypothetical protein
MKLTRQQRCALRRVYLRASEGKTYFQFRRTVFTYDKTCIMVPWCGMFLGIEADGEIHS